MKVKLLEELFEMRQRKYILNCSEECHDMDEPKDLQIPHKSRMSQKQKNPNSLMDELVF